VASPLQPRPYRALVRAFLLSELRAQGYGEATGSRPGALIAPFTWVVAQLLTMSLLLCLALFVRTSPAFFAAANLLVCGVSVFAAVAVEFHEAALDPADRAVLGWRPLTPRTYAAARGTTLLGYVAVVTASLTVLPATVGAGQWGAGPWWVPLYGAASICVGLGAAALVLLLHLGLGAGRVLDGLRTALAWLQIVGVMVGLYGGQLMLRDDTGDLEVFAYAPPRWFAALPTTALGDAVAAGSQIPSAAGPTLGAAVGISLALVAVGGGLLARRWRTLGPESGSRPVAEARPAAGTLARGRLQRALVRGLGRQGYAAFWLATVMLSRDRELLGRSLPALATGAAAVIVGLVTGQYGDPLDRGTPLALRALPVATVGLLASALPSLLHNAMYIRDHAAAWRLRSAPLRAPAQLAHGLTSAVLLLVGVPSAVAVGAVGLARWGAPGHAVAWTLGTLVVLALVAEAVLPTVVRDVPLSRSPARGVALGPIAVPVAGAASLASLLAGLASAAAGRPATLAVGCALLVVAGVVLRRRGRAALDRALSGSRP
jgi:hypothetical protein